MTSARVSGCASSSDTARSRSFDAGEMSPRANARRPAAARRVPARSASSSVARSTRPSSTRNRVACSRWYPTISSNSLICSPAASSSQSANCSCRCARGLLRHRVVGGDADEVVPEGEHVAAFPGRIGGGGPCGRERRCDPAPRPGLQGCQLDQCAVRQLLPDHRCAFEQIPLGGRSRSSRSSSSAWIVGGVLIMSRRRRLRRPSRPSARRRAGSRSAAARIR